MRLFSKQTGGFYTREINGESMPSDAVEITDEEYAAIRLGHSQGKLIASNQEGKPILQDVVLTAAQIIASYEADAQQKLESIAHLWGYDSVISIVGYAASGNPQFKADALAFIAWRDAFWVTANGVKNSVIGGAAMPATSAAFVAMLPAPPSKPVV